MNILKQAGQYVQKITGGADEDVKTAPPADFIEDDVTDITYPPANQRQLTSTMSPEELRRRRMNRVENAKLGRPVHENIMLFFLKCWLLVGPIAFVLLTAAEVAYILSNLVAPGDRNGQTIIWAGALFIELAMMFTTFGVAIKRRDLAEKKDIYGSVPIAEQLEAWFGTGLWLVFAAINIIGQSSFLMNVIASSHGKVPLTLLYIFVASRVTGFILGDASTAFFLAKVGDNDLKLVARAEREKGKLYTDLALAEGDRQLAEAKADASVLMVQIEVQQKQEDALFLADLKRSAFKDALGRTRPSELPAPNTQTALPSPEPETSRDTNARSNITRSDVRRSG